MLHENLHWDYVYTIIININVFTSSFYNKNTVTWYHTSCIFYIFCSNLSYKQQMPYTFYNFEMLKLL